MLAPFRTHPFWHLGVDVDLKELIASRIKQRAYLARYGRQSFRDRMTVVELERSVRALAELVQKENELSKAKEDQ